jgi:hypothetical protein
VNPINPKRRSSTNLKETYPYMYDHSIVLVLDLDMPLYLLCNHIHMELRDIPECPEYSLNLPEGSVTITF